MKKSGTSRTTSRSNPGVGSCVTWTSMSVAVTACTSGASASACPRLQRRAVRAYELSVRLPGPKSVPTKTVSRSIHDTIVFATGTSNPPSTKSPVPRSSSRTATASPPSGESETSARSCAGDSSCARENCHGIPSASPSASRSSSTSHSGAGASYSSSVVRRQSPCTWSASRQRP